jgi:hypothetical protein
MGGIVTMFGSVRQNALRSRSSLRHTSFFFSEREIASTHYFQTMGDNEYYLEVRAYSSLCLKLPEFKVLG